MTAAALSMVPGLGQLYNGEARKGILYFLAGFANFALLSLICLKGFLISGAKFIGSHMHVRLNSAVMDCLNNLDMRSPQMILLCLLLMSFTAFCVKDAVDRRQRIRRREIYTAEALQMSEAASGSYIAHALMFAAMFLLVLFLFVPPELRKQVVEIEFQPELTPTTKQIHSHIKSTKSSEDAGRIQPHKLSDTPVHRASKASPSVTPATARIKPAEAKPVQAKFEAKTETKPQPPKAQEPKAEASKPDSQKQTEKHEAAPAEVKTPKPPSPSPNTAKVPLTPAPLPAPSAARPNLSPTAVPSIQPTRTSNNSATGANAPQPLLAAALPSQFGSTPTPTASSSAGKSSALPAPAPASSHHGTSGIGPAAPEVQRDAGQHGGGSSAPQPVPSSGSPRSSSSTGDAGGPPVPHSVPIGSSGSNHIAMARPVVGTPDRAPGGTGVSPDVNTNDKRAGRRVEMQPDFSRYMAELQRRIKREWFPSRTPDSRRVVVMFKIFRNGELSHLRISQSSGDAKQDDMALKAVEHAAPFHPLPEGSDDDIDVQFTFDYRLFSGTGGGVKF